jgi:hypothetical protein
MNLHCLHDTPHAWLAEALERFEGQFWYPLGPGRRFRISHGRDYLPFFQAMGRATVLVAERGGEVLGTLARVERRVRILGENRLVHYLCDLKVAPSARGGRVLPALIQETRRQIEASGSHACYSIVMRGTGRTPADYTGRGGIPPFQKLADLMILRFSASAPLDAPAPIEETVPWMPAEKDLRITGGHSALRSLLQPVKLRVADACAVLEDTRRGKRLWMEDGDELVSAHLASLRFSSTPAAAVLIQRSLLAAQQAGFPAVFTAMPLSVWSALRSHVIHLSPQEAPAFLFGHDLPAGHDWWVDTAEI